MIANEKEFAPMTIVQERIQENERLLTIDRQSLAHMENSSWRHMDDLNCALGGVPEQGPNLFERIRAANQRSRNLGRPFPSVARSCRSKMTMTKAPSVRSKQHAR